MPDDWKQIFKDRVLDLLVEYNLDHLLEDGQKSVDEWDQGFQAGYWVKEGEVSELQELLKEKQTSEYYRGYENGLKNASKNSTS